MPRVEISGTPPITVVKEFAWGQRARELQVAETKEIAAARMRGKLQETWGGFVYDLEAEAFGELQRTGGVEIPAGVIFKGFVFEGQSLRVFPMFAHAGVKTRNWVLVKREPFEARQEKHGVFVGGWRFLSVEEKEIENIVQAVIWQNGEDITPFLVSRFLQGGDLGKEIIAYEVVERIADWEARKPKEVLRQMRSFLDRTQMEKYFHIRGPIADIDTARNHLFRLQQFVGAARGTV